MRFPLVLLEAGEAVKVMVSALLKLLVMSFQVSGLFMAKENTLYVNMNFVINGVLVTKDKKRLLCLSLL